jgi:hypothetical protein
MSETAHNRLFRLTVLALFFWGSGCAHRVMIDSDPPGATIRVGKKMMGVTPQEINVKWVPFQSTAVHLKSPGRRWVTIYVHKDVGPMRFFWQAMTLQVGKLSGKVPRAYHRAQFIKTHGPSGTWAPEEAK